MFSSNSPAAPALPSRSASGSSKNRPINLRTHDWGKKNEFGWSKFNRSRYLDYDWEPKNVLLKEAFEKPQNREINNINNINNSSWSSTPSISSNSYSSSSWSSAPVSSYSTISSIPAVSTISSIPAMSIPSIPSAPTQAAPASIVGVNMLPAPINSGAKYEKLTGQKRGTRRYRKHLKQPLAPLSGNGLSNNGLLNNNGLNSGLPLNNGLASQSPLYGMNTMGSSLPASQPIAGTRKSRRAQKKGLQNRENVSHSNTNLANPHLTRLGVTSAYSGVNNGALGSNNLGLGNNTLGSALPLGTLGSNGLNNGFSGNSFNSGLPLGSGLNNGGLSNGGLSNGALAPAGAHKTNRRARRAAKKNAALGGGFNSSNLAGSGLPANLPTMGQLPVTNVAGAPVLVQAAPSMIKQNPLQSTVSPLGLAAL